MFTETGNCRFPSDIRYLTASQAAQPNAACLLQAIVAPHQHFTVQRGFGLHALARDFDDLWLSSIQRRAGVTHDLLEARCAVHPNPDRTTQTL